MANAKEELAEYIKQMQAHKEQNDEMIYDLNMAKKNGFAMSEVHVPEAMQIREVGNALLLEKSIYDISQINDYFEEIRKLSGLLEQYKGKLLDENRKFGDIMQQPHSAAEVRLIEAATQFLDPHVLDGAIRENASASSVMGKIEDTKLFKANVELAIEHQKNYAAIEAQKAAQMQMIGQEAREISREFGVLDSISKSFSHTHKVKGQQIPDAREKDNQLER